MGQGERDIIRKRFFEDSILISDKCKRVNVGIRAAIK